MTADQINNRAVVDRDRAVVDRERHPEQEDRSAATRARPARRDRGAFVTPERARAARLRIDQREAMRVAMHATVVASRRNEGGIPPATMAASRLCGHWTADIGRCGQQPTRRYLAGWRCTEHAPPQAPTPDPKATAAALRERRGRLIDLYARAGTAQLRAFLAAVPTLVAAR